MSHVPASAPYDARAVANLLLDRARGLPITQIALQKLLFFAHGRYRITCDRPLVAGLFEAWKFGPVHPVVYQAFKHCEAAPITSRACSFDYIAGTPRPLPTPTDADANDHIDQVLATLGRLPIARLVEISHAPKGPWAQTVNKSGTSAVLGLQISDSMVAERFRFHMVALEKGAPHGDPREDTPLT